MRPVKDLELSRDGIPMKLAHMKLHVATSNTYLCSLLQYNKVNIKGGLSENNTTNFQPSFSLRHQDK